MLAHYAGIPKYIASRVAAAGIPSSVDPEDLIAYGVLGLAGAIDKYRTDKGASFETYAHSRVHGAVIDGLRTEDPVPRHSKDLLKRVTETTQEFTLEHGRSPDLTDIAEMTGLALQVVQDLLTHQDAYTCPMPIDGVLRDDRTASATPVTDLFPVPGPDQDGTDEQAAQATAVARVVSQLDSLPRAVVALLYLDNLTVPQVADACGLGERRVRRIHDAALSTLRTAVDTNALGEDLIDYRPTGTG